MRNDNLGDRMKQYEAVNRYYLTRRTPVIIRIDGKAFHSFTKGFKRPFDDVLRNAMHQTMLALCTEIQGCKLGYTQSDEISLLLTDYDRLESSAWFDYNVQKMASISASAATMYFNRFFRKETEKWKSCCKTAADETYLTTLEKACDKGAMFDARVFNLPKEEVTNYFLWRQNDATRNSIELVGHTWFSTSEMHKKSCNMIQDMLHEQKGINWNDYPTSYKRGSCCIKQKAENLEREKWVVDTEIPIFKGEDRVYIEKLVYPEMP